jgi:hypothetical protein
MGGAVDIGGAMISSSSWAENERFLLGEDIDIVVFSSSLAWSDWWRELGAMIAVSGSEGRSLLEGDSRVSFFA